MNFDHFNHHEHEMSKFRANAQRRIQNILSHVESILELIVESNQI